MKLWLILTLLLQPLMMLAQGQQSFGFTRIAIEDGTGLASNVVLSIHQDDKGFMWVGTANGLQRFDGRKFVQFSVGPGRNPLPIAGIEQIIPADSGRMMLLSESRNEVALFNPRNFEYNIIPLHTSTPAPARTDYYLWKDSKGDITLNLIGVGLLSYDYKTKSFVQKNQYGLPKDWKSSLSGFYEDTIKQQVWIACDSGLCVYDRATGRTWSRRYNPRRLPLLEHPQLQDRLSQIYIDKQRRIWVFGWPAWGDGGQYKFVFDSTGKPLSARDTAGLHTGMVGYMEYNHLFETEEGNLWIYGPGTLFHYDSSTARFVMHRSQTGNSLGIEYNSINQMLQDRDGALWLATDRGIYFAPSGDNNAIANMIVSIPSNVLSITDMLQMPNGEYWFAGWGYGIKSLDKNMTTVGNKVYAQPPPSDWPQNLKWGTKLPWTLCRQKSTGDVWIGCNGGILLIHQPQKGTTQYLQPEALGNSTIRYITEDADGNMWIGSQNGHIVRWDGKTFTPIQTVGTIVYKIIPDGTSLWVSTHEKGLYQINARNGSIIRHWSTQSHNKLYGNTGYDLEVLNDSMMVLGGSALNLIHKKTGAVTQITYEHGLPSNTVWRLHVDNQGYLWIISANGLSRYNPANHRITPYSRKDGFVLAEQTRYTDYKTADGKIFFAGEDAVVMFDPAALTDTKPPPDVTITDFKLFNDFLPVDSLQQHPHIRLSNQQNSFSIFFASLSFTQRDNLTYYFKMEGIDKDWIRADRSNYVNYTLLPPGRYTFKVYCENVEGLRSKNITELRLFIKPPFWQTAWFVASLLFLVALVVYAVHNMRINKLMAMEKLRNRVARDLHDDMGSTLSTINILSSMAKTKMNTDAVKTGEYLSKISDNSQRMMEAMDDIVWSIKPSNDSMQKITARMRAFATSVLEAKDIELLFEVSEEVHDVKLNMEARRDFFLVFKEAVNNAAKYSKATKVCIRLRQASRKLLLAISDNGRGFDVAAADGGNGLGNMHKRADNMNGRVRIQSAIGKGTTVTIEVPLVTKIKSDNS